MKVYISGAISNRDPEEVRKEFERAEKLLSSLGWEVVIDPCAGSGSTLLASARMGRRSYGFEIDKEYFSSVAHQSNLFGESVAHSD